MAGQGLHTSPSFTTVRAYGRDGEGGTAKDDTLTAPQGLMGDDDITVLRSAYNQVSVASALHASNTSFNALPQ